MASKAAESAQICPVCFETRPLKIAGGCKHSVCTECLTIALGSYDGDVFSCPTCQADCPRPWDGVKGLVDFTGESVTVEELGSLVSQTKVVDEDDVDVDKRTDRKNETEDRYVEPVPDVKCTVCCYKKKEVQAINLCADCNNLHICQDCTEDHGRNKATRGHVLIPFRSERKEEEDVCKMHDSPINRYCHECNKVMCVVCILLEHGDHHVEALGHLVESKANTLNVVLKEQEKKMAKLQDLEAELTLLTEVASLVDKQDVLTKEIEDHAQQCIDRIIKRKEELKGQVKKDYQVIRDISEYLKEVTEMLQKLQGPIQRAGRLLAETKHQPVYLDRLMALQHDFKALVETRVDVEGRGYTDQLQELRDSDYGFFPQVIDLIGKIEKTKANTSEFKPKEIFRFTMPADSNETFIPCVANLGQSFAVAHPVRQGEPSRAIDIYEFPGKLKHTFDDHVPPLYDMAATPRGKLAVLSEGIKGTSCSVKLFDSETGFISSTRDFDIVKPLSLGVTLRHQYVILGDNEQRKRQITVVDKDGRVEHTHVIKEMIGEKGIHPSRITCGGRFIFVIGKLGGFAYEINDTGIHGFNRCFNFTEPACNQHVDISANVCDSLFFTCIYKNALTLHKFIRNREGNFEWLKHGFSTLLNGLKGAYRETRVSTRNSHIVVYDGQSVVVYEEQE